LDAGGLIGAAGRPFNRSLTIRGYAKPGLVPGRACG
jgi:hypothetical protein